MLATYTHFNLITPNLDGNLLPDTQLPGQTRNEPAPVIMKNIRIYAYSHSPTSTAHASNILRQGVHGYLLKNAEEDVLIRAIETVYHGGLFLEDSMKEKLHRLDIRITRTVSAKSMLTPREKEILQLIVNGDTSQEIADKLFLSLHTVENYRTSIMLKMDVKNMAGLIKKALRDGWAD